MRLADKLKIYVGRKPYHRQHSLRDIAGCTPCSLCNSWDQFVQIKWTATVAQTGTGATSLPGIKPYHINGL